MCDADPTPGSYKLHVISPEKQKARILHGHESTILVKPSKDHVDAFKSGLDSSPPLKIIKHVRTISFVDLRNVDSIITLLLSRYFFNAQVKVGVKFPKVSSGNTPANICRNYAGGFYATS
jgi:hypothetical protein